jgi:hypothetical protein
MIKEDEIAGACGTEERWIYRVLVGKNLRRKLS